MEYNIQRNCNICDGRDARFRVPILVRCVKEKTRVLRKKKILISSYRVSYVILSVALTYAAICELYFLKLLKDISALDYNKTQS